MGALAWTRMVAWARPCLVHGTSQAMTPPSWHGRASTEVQGVFLLAWALDPSGLWP